MSTMTPVQRRQWAKEECRDALLAFFKARTEKLDLDYDDRHALAAQVNRLLEKVSGSAHVH